ncbi:MAG: adenylate/guanylate cyclase domain-containing protein [Candidatus Binatia bacterium]
MTFDEVLDQVRELLQNRGRVAYRALKRRFDLDDEYLEDLKAELIKAEGVAADEDGEVLVWIEKGIKGKTDKEINGETATANPQHPIPSTQHPAAERRQLTVMFIDLVGSTTLSQQLDPEDYHARVVTYQTACQHIVARYEGHIAQYLGDGVLVYFGYPTAHEDEAVRAVRSGLEIVTAIRQLTYTPPLQVRIGVHTGPVVVGEIGAGERTERLALGETPNIAARVQGAAEPDTVMISAATYHLVHGMFACHDLGPQTLKGIATPLTLYCVVRETDVQSRFEATVRTGLTPLIGRDEELALLRRRWEQAKEGEGQVVLLSGEAGIGKSRLVQEMKNQVSAEGATRIEFRCSPYHQNSAYYPLLTHLQRLLQFAADDAPPTKLAKLQDALMLYRFPQADTLPLLAALLSLPHPDDCPPITVSPQKQKEKTQEALVAWLVEEATRQAVYLVWEDLHWIDPSSLDVLTLVLQQVPTSRALVVLTYRPDFTSPWRQRAHSTQLTLSRLGRQHVAAMVNQVMAQAVLSDEVIRQIVSRTDGVPLFIEELTKSIAESVGAHGRATLPSSAIPATLHDSLMARLDRLGVAKTIAQLGATIGREFSYELLQAVTPIESAELQQSLQHLVDAELLYQRGLPPQATYLFKHALIQDTAYQSLLKSKRQQLHRQIAQVLEAQFPDTKETQPELLAHHYTEAGLREQAIPCWQQAGQKAAQRSANVEAIAHLTKGLELLKTLPDTPERVQREIDSQITLGPALMVTKGLAAPEVGQAYIRARELCQQVGETPQLLSVLFGLCRFYLNRADFQTGRELGEQFLRLAQRIEPTHLVGAQYILGMNLFWPGEFASARAPLEQGIALYNSQQHRPLAFIYGTDPEISCRAFLAWTLWALGYPDQAREKVQTELALAQEISHPFSVAFIHQCAAIFHQLCGDARATQEQAEALLAIACERGFPYWVAQGTIYRGWALAEQGQAEEGLTQIRQGLSDYQALRTEIHQTYLLGLLAEAYGKIEQTEEGLNTLTKVLALVDKIGERWYEAELYRLKGELTLQKLSVVSNQLSVTDPQPLTPDPQGEAEACFLKAIEIAQKQQAKSLELRASTSLARLWQQQGKRAEAHALLSGVYNWFTEGFDTKDLQEAKALLEELSH